MARRKLIERVHTKRVLKKENAKPWPLLIVRVGQADFPSMAKVRVFFEHRGFIIDVEDERYPTLRTWRSWRSYKLVIVVGEIREPPLTFLTQRFPDELGRQNFLLLADADLEQIVAVSTGTRTRIELITSIVQRIGGRRAVGRTLFYAKRSKWLQKIVDGKVSLFSALMVRERVIAEPEGFSESFLIGGVNISMALAAAPAQTEPRVHQPAQLDFKLAAIGTFLAAIGILGWIWLAKGISFDALATLIIALAALNLLRPAENGR